MSLILRFNAHTNNKNYYYKPFKLAQFSSCMVFFRGCNDMNHRIPLETAQ